jgi:hypothetical protein
MTQNPVTEPNSPTPSGPNGGPTTAPPVTPPPPAPPGGLVASPAPLSDPLAKAAEAIDKELRRKPDRLMKLEVNGGEALAIAQADFLADVTRDAIGLARKDRLQCVERIHIETAAERYGTGASESKLGSSLSTLGGLLAGAGLGAGSNLLFGAGNHSTAELVTVLVLCILGFFLLAIGLTLTMVGRR